MTQNSSEEEIVSYTLSIICEKLIVNIEFFIAYEMLQVLLQQHTSESSGEYQYQMGLTLSALSSSNLDMNIEDH